ncbi:MAG: PilZ domain-containing protein [Candidatus Caenarcaniphilales bacterium]|nr:PilZ domain-containing protein [Candidatus Caenarcaniphilales bacterium]
MQKEKKSECPIDVWMNAKVCLPDGDRGFAVARLTEEKDRSLSLTLTLDQSLLGNKDSQSLDTVKWNSILLNSQDNLHNLPKGTAILLAPPKIFGVKFWIARVNEPIKATGNAKENIEKNSVSYSLYELKRLKNFLEARTCPRIAFRTPVLYVEPQTFTVTQFFTHDVSQGGLSIAIDASYQEKIPFKNNENYLLQLKLHEGITMPALNYRCIHIREDVLTGAKLIGFSLEDHKANDPEVEYNLTLLTWADTPEAAGSAEKMEE